MENPAGIGKSTEIWVREDISVMADDVPLAGIASSFGMLLTISLSNRCGPGSRKQLCMVARRKRTSTIASFASFYARISL